MVVHFRLLTVQYFWWIAANLAKYPRGLPLGDYWILDIPDYPIANAGHSGAVA